MMSNEYYVGIDYSLEKLTVVISDSAKRPLSIFQVLMGYTTKDKIKQYHLDVKHYLVRGQFESFEIEKIVEHRRFLSAGSIHFQNRLSIMAKELKIFMSGFPREMIQRITMEAYSKFSRNDAFYTGEGYGSLKTLMYVTMGLELDYFPPPKKPKKYVFGNGEIEKEGIMYVLETEHGYKFLNDDMADGYMLSIYPFFAPKEDLITKIKT